MRFSTFSVAAVAVVASTVAAAAQAVTTRIETRPYYGAITTIEHGVRVMRALPPHDRIIINPHGKTPVSINVGSAEGGNTVVQQTTNQTTVNGPNAAYRGVPYVGVPRPFVRRPEMHQRTTSQPQKH